MMLLKQSGKITQTFLFGVFFIMAVVLFAPGFGVPVAHATPPLVFAGGDGSGGNPYQITTCDQFEHINSHLSASFILENDIDCTSDGNSVMIHNSHSLFTGTFDGGGNTITIAIDDSVGTYDAVGLFQKTDGATISNLNIAGTVESLYDTGALIGDAFSTEIDNVNSSATVTIDNNADWEPDVGGLVGFISDTSIFGSSATGNITSVDSVEGFGGLVGESDDSFIDASYATESVTMQNSADDDIDCAVGGLVGCLTDSSDITRSYSSGPISADYDAGGLVGYISSASIENSYANGTVSGESDLGGLVGWSDSGSLSQVYASGSVTGDGTNSEAGGLLGGASLSSFNNSFATGLVSNFTDTYGGFIGNDDGGNTYSNDYYDQINTGQSGCTSAGDVDGCASINTLGSPNPNAFKNTMSDGPLGSWDFTSTPIWDRFGSSYPTLDVISADDPTVLFDNGDGSSDNPYQISSCSEFENINNNLSSNFILENDIDCSGEGNSVMVGSGNFTGTFDGGGNTMTIAINDSTGDFDSVALFQTTEGAAISNLNIAGSVEALYETGALIANASDSEIDNVNSSATVTDDVNGDNEPDVGGLIGYMSNTTVSGSSVTGNIVADDSVEAFGGLVGQMDNDSQIDTSYTTGSVTMNGTDIDFAMGGFVGVQTGGVVEQDYSNSAVTNNTDGSIDDGLTGGFVGYSNASIEDSYETGPVSGSEELGGFVSVLDGGLIQRSYASGSVTGDGSGKNGAGFVSESVDSAEIDDSFSNGAVSNIPATYAGFVAYDDGDTSYSDDYYDQTTSGQTECVSGEGDFDDCTGVDTSGSPSVNYFKGNSSNLPLSNWYFGASGGGLQIIDKGRFNTNPLDPGVEVWDANRGFLPTLHGLSSDDPDVPPPFAGGDGSSKTPYEITSCAQFENINYFLTSDFVLENDIDCSGEGNNIMIVPSATGGGKLILSTSFIGTFDGGGNTITIAINDSAGNFDNVGLFQSTDAGATISNLNIAGSVEAQNTTGALVGHAQGTEIDNVNSSATVAIDENDDDEPDVGGLVGDLVSSSISGSSVTGNINATDSVEGLGGLVGEERGPSSITTSYVTGNVTFTAGSDNDVDCAVGGFVGCQYDSSDISESYATGAVTAPYEVGGFSGNTNNSTIEDSYATGAVNAKDTAGGFSGYLSNGEFDRVYASGVVTNTGSGDDGSGDEAGGLIGGAQLATINDSFSTGALTNFFTDMAGFLGEDDGGNTYSDNYYDQISSGQTECVSGEGDFDDCTGVDTSGSPDATYFLGNSTNPPLSAWDFTSTPVWDVFAGYLPTLHAIAADDPTLSSFDGGDGSSETPYQISSCSEFENINSYLSSYFVLENDLLCSGEGNNIMISSGPFTGVFDGGGHTITVAINDSAGNFTNVGLFQSTGSAMILNLNIAGSVEALYNTGALTADGENSEFDNDSSSATTTIDDNADYYPMVGGLFGTLNGSSATDDYVTSNVISNGSISGLGDFAGQINNDSTVVDSYSMGSVTMNSSDINEDYCAVGGFTGCDVAGSDISQSYATGAVITPFLGGGFVGVVIFASIEDAYATGAVSGSGALGGFAAWLVPSSVQRVYATGAVTGDGTGEDAGALSSAANDATIVDSFATGAITGFNEPYAGIVGFDQGDNVYTDDYYDQLTSGQTECASGEGDFIGCTGVDTSDSPDADYFKGNSTNPPLSNWDFVSTPVWDVFSGAYPTLDAITADDPAGSFAGGDGSNGNPYQISSCSQFENINDNLASSFVLQNDINCSGAGNNIMVSSAPFTGTFDGGGHTITIAIDDAVGNFDNVGLFQSTASSAVVSNLNIAGSIESVYGTGALVSNAVDSEFDNDSSSVTITIDDNSISYPSVGGLIGYSDDSAISNSYTTGTIVSNGSTSGLGGFIGVADDGTSIVDSYSNASVTMNSSDSGECEVGGFVGCDISDSDISQSYATGPVTSVVGAGGFVGFVGFASIEDSYATGAVSGHLDIGGFVAELIPSELEHVYASGSVTSDGTGELGGGLAGVANDAMINDSFSIGAVSNFADMYAGLIGDDEGGNTYSDDYYDQITSGQTECASGEGDFTGCTGVDTLDVPNANYFLGNSINAPLNTWDFSGVPVWDTAVGFLPTLHSLSSDDADIGATYRYIKWEIVKKRDAEDCAGNGCIQASEFIPTEDGSPVSWPDGTVATNPGGSNPDDQTPDKMIDGDDGTKWLDYNFALNNPDAVVGDSNLVIDTGADNTVTFNGYEWVTGDDVPERDPISWRVYGSNDGEAWTLLDTRSDQTITTNRSFETNIYPLHGGSTSEFAGGVGTIDNPFQVTTCAQFEGINDHLSSDFILENNIDCSGEGNSIMVATSNPFTGNFDGDGNTITVAIDDAAGDLDSVGLFQTTVNANISNINIAGSVESQYDTGALAGDTSGSEFDNDSSSATITIDDNDTVYPQVGGLIGHLTTGSVSNSYTTGDIVSNGTIGGLGGLVGWADNASSIAASYSTANVTMNSSDINGGIGGLVGFLYNGSQISQSYATGEITSPGNVGGLIGFIYDSVANDSYAIGAVSGVNNVGGFVGWSFGGQMNQVYASGSVTGSGGENGGGLVGYLYNSSTINNSFSTGAVSSFADDIGGLVGSDDTSNTYSNNFYDQTTTGQTECAFGDGDFSGCTGVDTSDSPDANYFFGNSSNSPFDQWDFASTPIWDAVSGWLPTLHAIAADDKTPTVNFSGGDGSEKHPYQITTCDQLQAMSTSLSSNYILNTDIDCSDTATWNPDSDEWVDGTVNGTLIPDDYASSTHTDIIVTNNGYFGFAPIGNDSTPFTGTLDGNGKTISNLWMFRKATDYNGLFGATSAASVHDVTLADSNIVGGQYTGGVVGYMDGGTISNVNLSSNMVRTYLNYYGGGLVGYATDAADISSVVNTDGVVHGSGDVIGGLVGALEDSTMEDSSSSASVDGGWEIGGVIGDLGNDSAVSDTYASGGTVTSNRSEYLVMKTGYEAGGFAGFIWDSSVDNSYSTDVVNSSGYYAGGFAGSLQSATVSNSYATGDVNGVEEINDGGTFDPNFVGGFVGETDYSTLNQTFASGNVATTGSYAGGYAGNIFQSTIDDAYAVGSASSTSYTGGFAGQINSSYDIERVYSSGLVVGGDPSTTGGLIGSTDSSGTLANAFWDTQSSNQETSNGGTDDDTTTMKTQGTFTDAGWDFDSTWEINESSNDGYPMLQFFAPESFSGGDGSSETPYQITSCAQFENINTNLSSSFILENDIDCSGDGNNIMISSGPFTGTFDGGENTITIAIDDSAGNFDDVGLFQTTSGATISNLNIAGSVESLYETGAFVGDAESSTFDTDSSSASITIDDNAGVESLVGGIAGEFDGSAITNSYTTGNLVANGSVRELGGLIGETDGGSSIFASYSTATVTANSDLGAAGGLVGYIHNESYISQSYATGAVFGENEIGGFAGGAQVSVIEDSYSTGNVSGESELGGFIGYSDFNTMNQVYSSGTVTGDGTDASTFAGGLIGYNVGYDGAQNIINNSFATGLVSNFVSVFGGLVGYDDGINVYTNDVYDQITTGQTECVAGDGDFTGCVGVDTSGSPDSNYFKENETNAPLASWDFTSTPIWDAVSGYLPTLHAISADDPGLPIDTTPPVITLLGAPHVILYQGQTYTDTGATASDNIDGNITGSIVTVNPVDTSTIGTYTVTYNVSDSSSNAAIQVSRTVDVLATSTTQSSASTSTDLDIYVPTSVTNGTLDLSSLQTSTTTATIGNNIIITANTNTGSAIITIPSGITVTSASSSWSGIINLPQPVSSPIVTPSSGNTATVDSAIEIGLGDTQMTFDKGIRIVFPGKAGKLVGWVISGSFTPITSTCTNDSQATGDALAFSSECKINNGGDLVVWTKHFTTYVVYTESPIVVSGGGNNSGGNSGGGGNTGGGSHGGGGGGYNLSFSVTPTSVSSSIPLSFSINDGTGQTSQPTLTIVMNADTSTVNGYSISTNSNFPQNVIIPYSNPATFVLPAPGTYTVYLKYYSTTGLQSPVISHSIVYTPIAIAPVIATPVTSPVKPSSSNAYVFTRNLSPGSYGPDVKALQQFLNMHGFIIAKSGPGSPGKENTTYGPGTMLALKKYQKAYGITQNGIFGPITRASVNSGKKVTTPRPSKGKAPVVKNDATFTGIVLDRGLFNTDLSLGMTNADVLRLQQFLNTHGFIIAKSGSGSPGKETNVFGPATQKALAQYQSTYGLAPATGFFGPETRAYVNGHQ